MSAAAVATMHQPTTHGGPSNHTRTIMQSTPIGLEPLAMAARANAPVETDGTFAHDRVVKNGWLMKRNKKTKTWKKRWIVLRGDRLSIYKDQDEYKIKKQILLADLTAVARLKDAKKPFVFGLFSPSRNYQFQAESEEDAEEWVDLTRQTAVLEDDSELHMAEAINRGIMDQSKAIENADTRVWSSSPEPSLNISASKIRSLNGGALSSHTLEYSGVELGSCSSVSDIAGISQLSLSPANDQHLNPPAPIMEEPTAPAQGVTRNLSGFSADDDSKTIWHGYLYLLKSKGGMKQWKKMWIVLRSKNLVFYKDNEEYKPVRLIPLDDIIDAVEIDPLSKSKKHCMQVIVGAKSYRFCASDEESLARWLGALKSTLAKRKTLTERPAEAPVNTPSPATATAAVAVVASKATGTSSTKP